MGGGNSKPETHVWNRNTIIDWTDEGAKALVEEIKQEGKKRAINILVFGPTGCGKSSLCNGFKTSLEMEKHVAKYFAVGTGQSASYTKHFESYEWEGITLYDMAGVFESPHIKSEDILNIIEGRVPFTGEIDDFLHPKTLVRPEQRKHVSCVVLVLKPGMELADNLKRIIGQITSSAGKGSLLYHLVLTHLDEVDNCFKDPNKLNQLLRSPKVQEAVKYMSGQVGIPPNAISFIRNYSHEASSNVKSTVLFLHTFNQIVYAASEQEEKRAMKAAAQ